MLEQWLYQNITNINQSNLLLYQDHTDPSLFVLAKPRQLNQQALLAILHTNVDSIILRPNFVFSDEWSRIQQLLANKFSVRTATDVEWYQRIRKYEDHSRLKYICNAEVSA